MAWCPVYQMRWACEYRAKYVRDGQLAATVVVPPNSKLVLEMLVAARRDGKTPPEQVLTVSTSFPSIEKLIRSQRDNKGRDS